MTAVSLLRTGGSAGATGSNEPASFVGKLPPVAAGTHTNRGHKPLPLLVDEPDDELSLAADELYEYEKLLAPSEALCPSEVLLPALSE